MARKPTAEVQLKLRFPESLRRRLEREAEREGRSMNSEIIFRLQRTFAVDDSGAATNILDFLRRMGVDVTKANEADVATALGAVMGHWISAAGIAQAAAEKKSKDDGEKQ
jgi:hypothetical protein